MKGLKHAGLQPKGRQKLTKTGQEMLAQLREETQLLNSMTVTTTDFYPQDEVGLVSGCG